MDAKTLEALKGSIAKWEKIVAGTGTDGGCGNCPLCQAFNPEDAAAEDECKGCPVAGKTGQTWCDGSPYTLLWGAIKPAYNRDFSGYVHTPASLAAAKAELDFLRSLLPEASKQEVA